MRAIATILILSIVSFSGCKRAVEESLPAEQEASRSEHVSVSEVVACCGKWVSEVDSLRLAIAPDGSFLVTPSDPERGPISGQWTEGGGVIELTNDSGAAVCAGAPGKYKWSINAEGHLIFQLIEDTCEPRIAHMQRPFFPEP